MSTEFPSKNGINRQWHVIDAQDVVLGKLASKAAMLLMGKTQTHLYPVPRYGRSRDRDQRRQGQADGPEGRRQAVSPLHRVSRRSGGNQRRSGCAQTRPTRMVEDAISGHASQDQARQADVPETECLRG